MTAPDLAAFDAMSESQLRHEARRWAFNASVAEDRLAAFRAEAQLRRDENQLKLARVAALLDVRHKTLRMDALRDALRETSVIDAEAGR